MTLPTKVYELMIDESDESLLSVFAVGLVGNPAIQRNWMAFSEEIIEHNFSSVNEEKRIVAGPLLVAGQKIPRVINGVKCEVFFSAETIEKIVTKFFRQANHGNFNINHDDDKPAGDCYMFQSLIINESLGMPTPKGFEPLPDGSWFGFVKVDNDIVWNDFIKTGKLKGFSVEGFFNQVLSTQKFNKNIMSKDKKTAIETAIDGLKKLLFEGEPPAPVTMGSVKLADGTEVSYEGELTDGTAVMIAGSPAPDGEHTLEDGRVMKVAEGKVTEISAIQEQEVMSAEAVQSAISEAMKAVEEKFNTQVKALEKENESLKKSIDEANKKSVETHKQMFEAIKLMADAPAPAPADDPLKKHASRTTEKRHRLLEIISKINTQN